MDWAHLDHLFVLLNSLPSRGSKFEHILVKKLSGMQPRKPKRRSGHGS